MLVDSGNMQEASRIQ